MSEPARAVFLSYAREDAAAVRRLASALRAAGVEVWFDESELRGGDAWDANIRRQIHECALFVPIISAQTQARKEGYFRREWKLAVDRLDDIAEGIPFLVPVCIDETKEKAALVPAAFLRVQWMRLPAGVAPEAFAQRVRQLLGHAQDGGRTTDDGGRRTQEARQRAEGGDHGPELTRTGRKGGATWPLIAAAALVIGGGAYFALRPATKESVTPASNSKPETPNSKPMDLASAKSIAVLPFANLSDDKDASAFFSDGIHEDILTNLSNIRELRVVSRTSVMGYRGTTKKMADIARELGVAFILEGSVRRAGNKVRVTGQLIRAATDEHVWARNFDRDLTDIFALQSELSRAIAAELKAAISPEESRRLQRRPTENIAAYDAVLKARHLKHTGIGTRQTIQAQLEILLRNAVQLDPTFGEAWAELAAVYSYDYSAYNRRPERLALAREAMDTANRFAPDSPDVIRARGDYFLRCYRDYTRATEQFERLVQLQSNDPEVYDLLGVLQRRSGKWSEAIASLRRSVEVDPRYAVGWQNLAGTLEFGRRFSEAIAVRRQFDELIPDDVVNRPRLALLAFQASGSKQEMETWLAGLGPTPPGSPGREERIRWALLTGDLAGYRRLEEESTRTDLDSAVLFAAAGDWEQARARLPDVARLRQDVEAQPENERLWARLAEVEALMGRSDDAVRSAQRARELLPESIDTLIGPGLSASYAFVLAWTGDKDKAIAEYARLLRVPGDSKLNVHQMKVSPRYAPLRGDPRFEALLADPKNKAPLF